MRFFPDPKTFLTIGSIAIRWYALTFLGGALVTYIFMKRDFRKHGYKPETVDDLFVGCLLWGIVAARIWYCLFSDPVYYFSNPIHVLQINQGGIGIQGGILGGLAYGWYYAHKHKMSFLRTTDSVMPNMLIAQAIGRWGNFINQEAFGQAVNESFYNGFPSFIKNGMYIDGAYRQPTFLWESGLDLLGFILIRYVYKKYSKNKRRGDLSALYLVWYGISRFIVEGFRTDNLMFLGMKMSQLMAIVFCLVGFALYFFIRRKKPQSKPIVLFDLDGTLIDSEPAITASYLHLFETYRKAEDFDADKRIEVLGPPLHDMMVKYFPDQDPDKMVEEYRVYQNSIHDQVVKPMPGAADLLKWLKENGYSVGVVSTKMSDLLKHGLKLFGMDGYVDTVVGHEMVKVEKPDPEGICMAAEKLGKGMDELLYIGDNATDVMAGKSAGGYTVAYLSTPEKKEDIVKAKPNEIISNLSEVKDMLQKEEHEWTYDTI